MAYNYNLLKLSSYAKRAKGIVVPSHYVKKQVSQRLGISSTVIHHSVNQKMFHIRDKIKIRDYLGLPRDKEIFLNVSGGGSNKNMITLQNIVEKFKENQILIKVNTNLSGKNIINIGKVDDRIYPLYFSAADAYIHTSTNEGFGIPLIESLSSGLPVVSNKLSTSIEILNEAGSYVNDPYDSEEYIDVLSSVLDLKNSVNLSCLSIKRSNSFNEDVVSEKYIKFYHDILKS